MRLFFCIFAVLTTLTSALWAQDADKEGGGEAQGDDAELIQLDWAKTSRSPRLAEPSAVDAPLHALCGKRELGLAKVASAIIERRIAGAPPFSQRAIKRIARSAGVPYPYIAAWSRKGTKSSPRVRGIKTQKRLAAWLSRQVKEGRRRCGVARGTLASGQEVVAVVVADALAELTPLATEVKVSRWINLRASVHPNAANAKVVLLGPRGLPKRVLASLDRGSVKSRFMLDRPGRWIVQVVAGMPSGPRPVLEVEIFAGVERPSELRDEQPETAGKKGATKHDARDLFKWINRARKREGFTPVKRSAKLDRLARAHAIAMVRKGRVIHDAGDGTPQERVAEGGLRASRVGENVARAATVRRIHDAIWDSPSHRENMLDGSFRYVGVAAVKDTRGRVWSVQLYADRL